MALSKQQDPNLIPDDPSWNPNTKFHKEKLQTFCRICCEPRALSSDRYPTSCKAYAFEIEEIWGVDVFTDSVTIHPPYICRACVIKIDRFYQSKKRSSKVRQPKIKPVYEFSEHAKTGCEICSYSDQIRYSPRKKLYPEDEVESLNITPEKSAKRLLHRLSTPMSGFSQMVTTPPSGSNTGATSSQASTSKLSRDKTVLLEEEKQEESQLHENLKLDISHNVSESVPVEKFVEEHVAKEMQCLICFEVPLEPTITPCGHFHCKTCIRQWLETSDSCTNCRSTLSIHDIAEISGFRQAVFEAVHVWCQYKPSGCETKLLLRQYLDHEENCKFKYVEVSEQTGRIQQSIGNDQITAPSAQENQIEQPRQKRRGAGTKKKSLFDWSDRCWPLKRIKEVNDKLDAFCTEKNENKLDVLFFLLREELEKNGKKEMAKRLINLRKSKETYTLSTEQCLSVRADSLLSKGQYRKIYGIFDQNLDLNPLQPPSQLDVEENKHLPGATDFQIIDKNGTTVFSHQGKENIKPINILSDLQHCASEIQSPNVKGVKYNYAEALVSTLLEIDPYIEKSIKENPDVDCDQIFHTTVKDGGDGLGSVSVYKEKADRFLPDKALRFSFAVISSTAKTSDNTTKTVYEADNPNSVRVNRPLLECIADENNKASSIVCLSPIEMEREYLQDKVIQVKISEGKWRLHKLKFFNSMVDEKYDRAMSGYQGSGSKYICVLCDTTQEDCKKHLGSFKINRTYKETKILANILKLNPDNMAASDLAKISKGVKSLPVSHSQPMDKLIDATHADINLGIFFQKLIVRAMGCNTRCCSLIE